VSRIVKLSSESLEDFIKFVVDKQEGKLQKVNVPFLSKAWRGLVDNHIGKVFAFHQGFKPGGFLLALFTPDMITGDMFAIQYLWMVAPEARGDGNALKLLDEFEEEAQILGCKFILGGSNAVSRPAAMRRLFSKRGYAPFSEAFIKPVSTIYG
jgi:GNAT superfamily N-acetyltransferase